MRSIHTNARIQSSEAVSILNGQRGLANAAHTLHRRATDRSLSHRSGLVVHQEGVEPVEFVGATRETRDARRHPDERTWWRCGCLRLALGGGDDATHALFGVFDAHEVLIDVVGEQPAQWHIATAQHDNVALFGSP